MQRASHSTLSLTVSVRMQYSHYIAEPWKTLEAYARNHCKTQLIAEWCSLDTIHWYYPLPSECLLAAAVLT